jgi:hypothetical protein
MVLDRGLFAWSVMGEAEDVEVAIEGTHRNRPNLTVQ